MYKKKVQIFKKFKYMKTKLNNKLLCSYVGGTFENYVSAIMTCFRVKIKSIEVIDESCLKVSFYNNTLRVKKIIEQTRDHIAKFKKTTFKKEDKIGSMKDIYSVKLSVFGEPEIDNSNIIKMKSGCIYETITIFPPSVRPGKIINIY